MRQKQLRQLGCLCLKELKRTVSTSTIRGRQGVSAHVARKSQRAPGRRVTVRLTARATNERRMNVFGKMVLLRPPNSSWGALAGPDTSAAQAEK